MEGVRLAGVDVIDLQLHAALEVFLGIAALLHEQAEAQVVGRGLVSLGAEAADLHALGIRGSGKQALEEREVGARPGEIAFERDDLLGELFLCSAVDLVLGFAGGRQCRVALTLGGRLAQLRAQLVDLGGEFTAVGTTEVAPVLVDRDADSSCGYLVRRLWTSRR